MGKEQKAKKPPDAKALKAEIKVLVGTDPIELEFKREELSKKYGVRKKVIDDYLYKLNKEYLVDTQSVVDEVKPSDDWVDGEEMINEILNVLVSRVIMPEGAAVAISLWVVMTYCERAFSIMPMLGIVSPEKRCGKTTLIEILQGLTEKGLAASNLTAAAVYRTIERYTPTLLIDEADTFLKGNEELRGVINSGHKRTTAHVIRCHPVTLEPEKFSTWSPKAIGMIGKLKGTLEDRSIIIELKRKLRDERVKKTSMDFSAEVSGLRSRVKRWSDDNFINIAEVVLSIPPSGNDRADDNWSPLFSIADALGGDWLAKAQSAMNKLSDRDDDALGTILLSDISKIFDGHPHDRIFSSDLVEQLNEISDSPWADWRKGKGLSTNGLAIKPFKIKSKTMRIESDTKKGYELKSFQDSFKRYLPPIQNVTPLQPNDISNLEDNQSVTQGNDVTFQNTDKPLDSLNCYGVTFQNTPKGQLEEKNRKIDSPTTLKCVGCGAHDRGKDLCYAAAVFEGKSGSGIPCKDVVKNCEYVKNVKN